VHGTAAAFESEWVKAIDLGIKDMTEKLRDGLKPPRPSGVPTS
jgi:hypothetical protein